MNLLEERLCSRVSLLTWLFLKCFFILVVCFIMTAFIHQYIWLNNILLFHTSIELICIFIGLSAFFVVLNIRQFNNISSYILGFGFLSVAVLNIFHVLYYPGFEWNVYMTPDLSLKFSVIGRLAKVIVIFFSTLTVFKKIKSHYALLITVIITSVLCSMPIILNRYFPAVYVNNHNTMTKIIFELFTFLLLFTSIARLSKKLEEQGLLKYKYIVMALIITIPVGVCSVVYTYAITFSNIYSHVLKVVCYYFLFRGIFVSAVTYPVEKLKETGEDMNEILNSLPVALLTFDNNSKLSFVNESGLKLLECETEDIEGLTIKQIQELLNFEEFHQGNSTMNNNMVAVYETDKGNVKKLGFSLHRYRNGILVTFKDIRREQELENLQIQTQTILNSITNMVVVIGLDNKVIMCNRAFCEFVGITRDRIINFDFIKLKNNLYYQIIKSNTTNFTGEEQDRYFEVSLTTAEGLRKIVLVYESTVRNLDDQVIGYINIITDITDMKVEHENKIHQKKMALLGQMGSGIVHETKNYLSTIKGYCQLMKLKCGSRNNELRKYITRIEHVTTDVNRIVSDFLLMAKRRTLKKNDIFLSELIESMRYMLESPSFIKDIPIKIDTAKKEKKISGDKSLLSQVLLNMAKNAIEAMTDVENPILYIKTQMSDCGNLMQLIISDNGEGMTGENIKKIGEPFFTTKDTGTGLGMSICYRVIAEHRGEIEVESVPGKGTKFIISLPCSEKYIKKTVTDSA